MPPEVVKSLPGPDPWIAFVAPLFIGAAGLAIGIWTLSRVYAQIRIAARSFRLAAKELALTRASNALVQQDLEFSREQVRYISRKAKLELWHNDKKGPDLYSSTESDDEIETGLRLWLFNEGNNTARDAAIFLWLPRSWRVPGWDGLHHPEQAFRAHGLTYIANVELYGKRWLHIVYDVPFPTYPHVQRLALTFPVIVPVGFNGRMLWRVGFDDGIEPPPDKEHGSLHYCFFNRRRGIPKVESE
jgi:hypothetical protein